MDAYCGSGLFAVSCHTLFEKVAGIEISKDSVGHASHNAALNGAADKCSFLTGSAENIFEKVMKGQEEGGFGWKGEDTAMVIDPPRKGCSEDFLDQLLGFAPRVCVYVSCNVFSQARDLVYLRKRFVEEEGKVPKYRMVAARRKFWSDWFFFCVPCLPAGALYADGMLMIVFLFFSLGDSF